MFPYKYNKNTKKDKKKEHDASKQKICFNKCLYLSKDLHTGSKKLACWRVSLSVLTN